MNRRTFTLSSLCSLFGTFNLFAADAPTGPFTLAPLPYAKDALEPYIDAMTMETHHGKHHQTYVTKLNEALATAKDFVPGTLDELQGKIAAAPESIRTALRNHGGGHWNHTFFWSCLAPTSAGGGAEPTGKLADALKASFGSVADFQTKFSETAVKVFGSGWAWLVQKPDGSLAIVTTPNQDNPLMKGVVEEKNLGTPLLGIDVWEHAYYLKHKQKRPDYVADFLKVVNWKAVGSRLK